VDKLDILKQVLYVDRIYHALNILHARQQENSCKVVDLRTYELRLFSQNGEDGVLDAILRALQDSPPFFVEFGVGDGWSCNTRLLAEVFEWNGLFIEVEHDDYLKLAERYCHSKTVCCLESTVTPENINQIFADHRVPGRFGVLSIDIDGQDYWVWEALDAIYQPDIVIIEFNSAHKPDQHIVEKKGLPLELPLTGTWGASLGALQSLGNKKGYKLVHTEMAGVNAFFIREALLAERELTFLGVTRRSPNFGLRGLNHSSLTLYGTSGNMSNRPLADL